jgi:glycosyltransferase involved in cell wall biosynthesis
MRICFLADAPYIHTVRWLRYFAGRGYDVHVVTFRDAGVPGVTVHHIAGLEWTGKGRYLLRAAQVRRLVRALKPDLLHAMHLTSYGFLGALCGVHPFISSVWGHDVFVVPHWTPLHWAITRYALARADLITATGPSMAAAAARYAPKGAEIVAVPYGVDLAQFRPAPRAGRENVVIGYVGRLSREKGVDDLIEAAACAVRSHPRLEFWIAGDGPERGRLQARAARRGLAERVRFLGAVEHEAVPSLLQQMDIFLLPSHAEGFGVAAVEAAAMELPVVGANIQGIPDVVQHGRTGLLVPPARPDLLARAILTLATDATLRSTMGRTARAYVAERYDWTENARKMELLYERVIQDCQRMRTQRQ